MQTQSVSDQTTAPYLAVEVAGGVGVPGVLQDVGAVEPAEVVVVPRVRAAVHDAVGARACMYVGVVGVGVGVNSGCRRWACLSEYLTVV